MSNAADRDFSETLDRVWDFEAPAVSEGRFRAELAKHPARSREAREATTQIARALGLQRKFAQADAALDSLKNNVDEPPRVRVRYLLERGRVRNSSGSPADAVPLFKKAVDVAAKDALPGADFYRVDALHMLGIAARADEQLRWNLEALAVADASNDARALGLRSLNRLDEAETMQHELIAETTAAEPDGFVYEELAEIALARNDNHAAKEWAAKAYAYLKNDIWLAANEKARLERLARIGGVATE